MRDYQDRCPYCGGVHWRSEHRACAVGPTLRWPNVPRRARLPLALAALFILGMFAFTRDVPHEDPPVRPVRLASHADNQIAASPPPIAAVARNDAANAEYARRQAQAEAEARLQRYAVDVQTFLGAINSARRSYDIIYTVRGSRYGTNDVEIVVGDSWAWAPQGIRKRTAIALWKVWASIHSPTEPDRSTISLFDTANNSVGGSSSLAGSLVSVDP